MPDPTTPRSAPDLSELVRRRLAETHADLNHYGALDLAAARPRLTVPCAVSLTLEDVAAAPLGPNLDAGPVVQQVTTTVAVVLGVSAARDPGGSRGTASAGLRERVSALRETLHGWTPDGAFPAFPPPTEGDPPRDPTTWPMAGGVWRPLVLRRGGLLSVGEDRAWWQDEYVSSWLLRSTPPAAETPRARQVYVSLNQGPEIGPLGAAQ